MDLRQLGSACERGEESDGKSDSGKPGARAGVEGKKERGGEGRGGETRGMNI